MSSPTSTASTSQPPIAAETNATSVTEEERKAIFAVFDKYGEGLVEWRFVSQNLHPPRLHEVLRLLVQEGAVKRVEAADAVRYSRG